MDLGSAFAVDGVIQGGYDTNGRHMSAFTLSYSDDGSSWTVVGSKTGLSFPGFFAASSIYTFP